MSSKQIQITIDFEASVNGRGAFVHAFYAHDELLSETRSIVYTLRSIFEKKYKVVRSEITKIPLPAAKLDSENLL